MAEGSEFSPDTRRPWREILRGVAKEAFWIAMLCGILVFLWLGSSLVFLGPNSLNPARHPSIARVHRPLMRAALVLYLAPKVCRALNVRVRGREVGYKLYAGVALFLFVFL